MKLHAANTNDTAKTLCNIAANADNIASNVEEVTCLTCQKLASTNTSPVPETAPIVVSTIAKKALLVRVNIGLPPQTKLDKKASGEMAEQKGADSRSVRVTKHLFDPSSYAKLMSVMDKIRNYYYFRTLPWDAGTRILSIDAYGTFTARMRELRDEWDRTKKEFCANYAEELDKARAMLTDSLFNASEYPSEFEIESRFRFDVHFLPIPTANDFRVEMSADDMTAIKAEMEQAVASTFQDSMKAVWERLYIALAGEDKKPGLIQKLQSERISQATLDAMTRLLDLLPTLNITGDPRLDEMSTELRQVLSRTAETLRSSEDERNKTALEAEKIAKKMEGFMAAFG